MLGNTPTILDERPELLAQTVDKFSGGKIELRMDVSYELRRRALLWVRAEVCCKAGVVRRAAEGPLVWYVVNRLVLVARRSKRATGGLKCNRVGVLGHFSSDPSTGDSESVLRPGKRYRGNGRVVRK